jgi:hypothetical protein
MSTACSPKANRENTLNDISLFPRILCHQKYFKTVNQTTHKIHSFILDFHNTKLYVISLVVYVMK